MSRTVRSTLALLLLTLFLGTGAAYALPSEGSSLDRDPGMLATIWNWVTSVVEIKVPLFQVHDADGQTLPSGNQDGKTGSSNDGGAFIDPFG